MEIKTKELKQANYAMACTQGDYEIVANVTIGADNKVVNMDSGQIYKNGAFLASFGLYGNNQNVNYSGLTLDEKNEVNQLIEIFKKTVTTI